MDKKLIIFYNNTEIPRDDDEKIGENFDGSEVDLVMTSITMNQSELGNESVIQEKVINKVSKECKYHKGAKELNICVKCKVAFCQECSDKHKNHESITKKDLIKYLNQLNTKSEEMTRLFNEYNINDKFEICKNERQTLETHLEKMQNMIDDIRKKSKKILLDFKTSYDMIYPYLIEFQLKLKKISEKTSRLQTLNNEQELIDNYFWYLNVKKKEPYTLQQTNLMKNKVESLKEVLNIFNLTTQQIIENTEPSYIFLKNIQYFENDSEQMTNNSSLIMKPNSQFNQKNSSSSINPGKMTLVTLLAPDKIKNDFIKQEQKNFILRRKSTISREIEEKNQPQDTIVKKDIVANTEDLPNKEIIYGIEPKTQNLFNFNIKTKKIERIKLNIDGSLIKKFEPYLSTLNYNGRFYICGGYSTSKLLFRLNVLNNSLLKLSDMFSGHSYHGMIGINNNIFAVSGFKNKNIEKYDIQNNRWELLEQLEESRSSPCCLSYEEKFLYVFGGLSENNTEIKSIKKLDISNNLSKWENIELNANDKIPFYFGVLKLNDKNILLLGGKYDIRGGNLNTCFNYSFENNLIEKNNDFILPNKEEFNGKMFSELEQGLFGEFSSVFYDRVYLINTVSKEIEVIQ